ncbi:uncharacterized protein LOC128241762 isoform X2 [Mya arenaria]|uniref:uncharacterized protein LOC128241762 isoform X2 n=1 Tax=Mya arenaria TaxID=6604 RepID=UPI0022E33AB9|nr:uncharacterized protein LOC128241762 isoform X2 [Mya arenaria]
MVGAKNVRMKFSEILKLALVGLGLSQICVQADDHVFEKLGELEFQCPDGWIIHKANCYKKVDVEMTFNEASTTCYLEGAHLLYLANEIEHDEVIARNAPGMNIWMGYETNGTHIGRNVTSFHTPSDRIPRWANYEPAQNMHDIDCILDDYKKGLIVRACDEMHPFFCKRRACLKGYMSCDTATKCVPEARKCDGKLDCLDTRDELDCPTDMNYIDVETSGNFSTRTLYSGQQRIWTMKAPIGRRIKLYVPSMTLETNVAFLEVWTGNPTFAVSRLIKRFTGTVSAGVYLYSDNNYMTVRLYANNLQQNFNAKTLSYTADNTNIFLGYKDLDATVALKSLTFPYQGMEYKPEGLHLRWRITALGGDYITYYVEPIDKTKPTSGKIRGGMTYLEPGDVRVTGRKELHITMEGVPENLQLMYKSGCGDITLMHEYGTIQLFDELIPNNATCTWTLKGGEAVGRGLALKFMNDLYDDPRTTLATKSMDIFTIEGSGGTETEVENYPAMIYHSSNGTFKVTFQSDVALNSKSSSFDFGADCPMLDVSEQTEINKNTTYFDEDVLLTCPTGYDFHLEKYAPRASLTLRCTKGSWYIDDDKLAAIPECKMVFCGAPPKVNNAYVTYASGGSYMSVATYACNPGFNMAGGPNATCMDSGEWGGYPSCSSSSCNALPDNLVLNGRLEIRGGNNFTGGNADFDTVVQFFCNDGYELVGTVRTHCNASGWTHGTTPPTCQRLSCEKPSLPNGVYNPVGEIQFGDTLTATCNAGYQFKDNPDSLSLTMTCRENQTFDTVDECIDIDECQAGTSGCDLDSTACRNNVGGRECICKDGFNNPTGETTCSDINECLENNGGCYDMANCVNAPGTYSCTCPNGHKLFETNGDQGFTLQASETGLGENDMYRINHTCVPLECPGLPNIQNGWYLTRETQFHFNEGVDIHCADGYFFASDGITTSDTDGKLTCKAAGNWDITPSCSARECLVPVRPLNGMYDTEKVVFGEQLTLTCNLSESEQITRQAICLFNGTEKGVVFGGDDINVCPEINCGDPDDVMPQAGTYAGNKPLTFTYWSETSKFTFDCSAGSRVTGKSEDEDMDVKCKANGRWSLGSLGCLGEMCMDPGTPGDANQVALGYEIDATLSYACTRTGFKPTGPENYTCEYNNVAAVWSGNLDNVLPTCEDITKPTYDKCQTEPQTAFKMESANFDVPTFGDNFAIQSVSKTGFALPGDVMTSNETVTYTANDFNGNSATCSSSIVVSERKKPSIDCLSEKIISVEDRTQTVYNVSDWKTQFYQEVDAHTTELLSIVPESVISDVSKIGASKEIVVTVGFADGANMGVESQCKFRVFYKAGACFEESLFSDSFATTICVDTGVGGLECTRTCSNGYVFGDGATSKTFICSSPNTWDFNQADPTNRYCLPIQTSDDTIDVQVIYDYAFLNHNCLGIFFNKMDGELITFENNVRSSCNENWDAQVVTVNLVQTAKFSATLKLTLLSSATTTEKNNCLDNIRNNSALFNFGNTDLTCGSVTAAISVDLTSTGDIEVTCQQSYHFKVTSADLAVDVCVPCGPGLIYSSTSQSCEACPDGQYQENNMQTTCVSCNSGLYPNAARTKCQVTCPAGYTSTDGFYPCTPCAADSYSANTTTCIQCPNGGSTVGVPAASSEQQCFDPCPEGQYSLSGFMNTECSPCPLHHYQTIPGMTYCDPCPTTHMTLQTGSVNNTFCFLIEGCNRTYCSDRGTCATAFGRKNCQCDGYYGEQCEDNYHICSGNPCTNGGTCVPGDGPMDYTCSCVKDYDVCIMENKADMMAGNVTGQSGYSIVQDKAECEQLCLDDENCIEATFLTSAIGISACRLFNITAYLEPATIAGTVHMSKHCTSGFTGENCEVDNIDNCNNSQCHENSRCVDKINDYGCICSSSGGFGGQYCKTSTNPCDDSPCQHGTCQNFDNVRYECICQDGYDGIKCNNNTNECNAHPNACMYGGSCVDRVNGYECNCMTGFTGEHCEIVPNYCSSGDCQEENVCYSSLDAHDGVCSCDSRFFEPVYLCDMQDTIGKSLGDSEANVIGGVRIVQSIQECKDLCQYEPDCGYAKYEEFSAGKSCLLYKRGPVNEIDTAGSTLIKKDCSNEGTHYNCNRKATPCDTITCYNNGTCSDNGYVGTCQCAAGFWGSRCQYSVDDCVNNNCQNGAVCEDGYIGFTCGCLAGFEGNQCETNTDDCPGLCNSTQGTCQDLVNGYDCVCEAGYQGSNCELEIDECLSYPCKHGADCEDMVNDYSCMCEEGWTGKNCDTEIDHCESRTCQNSGQCFNLPESSFCRCEGGALGENCENATLVCDVMSGTDVCQNRGLCTNKPGTASCECPPDYDVRRCYFDEGSEGRSGGQQTTSEPLEVDDLEACKTRCLDNPKCDDMVFVTIFKYCYLYEREKFVSTPDESTRVHYRRICPTDYTGDSCEQVKDWCSDENNPCENGGECTPKGPVGYTCMCKPGYSGVTCNIDADPCSTTPCAGVAKCQSTVTEHICQCEQGKIFTGSQCRDDPTRPVILVNNLFGVLDAPTLQTPFRWTTQTISIMFMIRVHASPDNELASLLNIYVQNSLNPNYQDYMYWISVSRRGIGVKTNMSPWLGVTFNEDFGSELGDGSWHHLGIAINENRMLSATLDAITIDDAVEVASPPAGEKNVQISLGYLNLAEYQDVSVWNVTLTSRDFALASVGTQPSINPIQGWWNYDPKTSGMRLTERLPHNLLDDPNINFPQMNCDGFENIMHVSAERVVDRDTFVGKIEEVKENTNGTLTFKHSLPPSLTWGFYETVIVGVNSNTLNYGECRVQLVVKYNDVCPAARSDNTESEVCPSGADAVCDLACLEPNKALFAPVSKYISCGTLGVWDTRKPYDDLVLPGCTISGDPRYAVTSMMKFETVIPCRNLDINTKVTDRLTDVLMNDVNGIKWTGLCTGDMCDNLAITKAACIGNTNTFEVVFTLTYSSKTITAIGGGETSVLDALRIIILLEKDLSMQEIASASLLEDTVEITMEEVCGDGYALMMSDNSRACVPCGPGWKFDTEKKECVLCDYGHYQNGIAQTECIPCGNDKWTNFRGARDENDCIITCEAGTYYDVDEEQCMDCKRHYFQNMTGQDYCFPCPLGYKTVGNRSTSIAACTEDCFPGYVRNPQNLTECVRCNRGTFRSTQDDCVPCTDGKYTLEDTIAMDSSNCDMDICDFGEFWNVSASNCQKCDFGYYQNEMYELQCKMCASDYSTRDMGAQNDSFCEFYCPVGEELNAGTNCASCERGSFKDNVGLNKFNPCKECSTGKTTETTGSTSESNCSIPACSIGKYIMNGVCEPCPQDKFSNDELPTSETTCLSCTGPDDGTYGTENTGSSSSDCKRYCAVGFGLSTDNACAICERGFFSDNSGNTRFEGCQQCQRDFKGDKTTNITGATRSIDCDMYKCGPGEISTENGCDECPIDTYQSMDHPYSSTVCQPCMNIGIFETGTTAAGVSNSDDCKPFCPSGYIINGESTGCDPCSRGSYKNNEDNRFAAVCNECPVGTTTESMASTHIDNCSIPACIAGQYILNGDCTNCPIDTYSTEELPTSETECTSCTDECDLCDIRGTEGPGASSVEECKVICGAGKEYIESSNTCDDCSRGTFKEDADRFGMCKNCTNSDYTTPGEGAVSNDECDIRACAPGYKINGPNCEECPQGTYQNQSYQSFCYPCGTNLNTEGPASDSANDCQLFCSAGLQATAEKNDCAICPEHTYKEVEGFSPCINCPTDTTSFDNRTACGLVYCSAGKRLTPDETGCEPCGVRFYKPDAGNTECLECDDGLTTDGEGQASCTKPWCVPGKYLSGEECVLCAEGSYKASHGNDVCTECASGFTTSRNGSTAVLECDTVVCPAGQFRDPGQKEQCSLCPLNTYQPGVGETMCINCEAGQITLEAKSTMNTDCVPLCGKGEQYNAVTKECDKCVKGKYKDVEGNTEMCMMCPTDKTTLGTGSTDSSDCSQTLCPIGTYYKVTAGTTQCIPCEKGTYNARINQPSCTNCPPGNTTLQSGRRSHDDCVDQCKAGNGFDTFDQTCKICRPGEYNDAMGNNADFCKQCPSGKTSTQSGASACNVVVDDPVIEEKQVNIPMRLVFFVALDSCDDTSNLKIIYDLILNTIRTLFNAISNSSYNNNKRGFCRGNKCDNLVFVGLSTCGARGNSAGRRRRAADTEITVDFALKNVSSYTEDSNDGSVLKTKDVVGKIITQNRDNMTVVNDEIVFGDLSNITETPLCNPGEKRNNELCENCPAGSSGTDGLVCSQCGTGQYQDVVGQTSCKACPEKTFNNKNGSTTADDCLPICGPGKQFNNVSCDMCPIGTYKSVEGNAAMCEPCPSGFTTENQGATSRNDCSQRECEPGTYHVQNSVPITCTDCPIGTYSTASMVTQCTPCSTGKTTLATKSTSADACTTLCSNGRGLNLQTRGCDTCPVGQYNDASSGANPNFCKTCKSGTTNYQTGQSSCPATVDAVVYQYRKYEVMLKYKADIAGCHVDISGIQTQVSLAIRQTFISQRVARYNGQRSFCPSTTCNNIAVDFDKGTNCKLVTRRRKRALDYELDFLVSLSNISNVITDSVQKEEMMAKDIILLILNQNAAQLQPSTLAGIVQYDSIVTIASKEICTSGNELRGDVCNPCTLGHYGTDGETCKPCAADRYQDETGQADCKLCPANTYNDDFGATGPLACKDYCTTHPLSCNNGGKCVATGRRTFTCNCYENYGGQYCNEKKTPTSNMPVILGAAIGGGGALLIIILVVVGCYKYLSVKDKREKKPDYRYGEFDQPMFVGTYDNVGFNGSMPRPIAPYPSIGYPSLGYKPQETSFDHGSITSPYRMRPGVNGDPIEEDDAQYIWTA